MSELGCKKRFRRRRQLLSPRNIASDASSRKLDISWTPGFIPATKYEVYRDGTLVGETSQLSKAVEDLTEGTSYTINVVAIDQSGFRSNPVTIVDSTEIPIIGILRHCS
jgi:fibronectin type 3 domain-containing protein